MNKKLIPVLISALCVLNSGQLMASQNAEHTTTDEEYLSVSACAASGALIAGPVGFILGGLVGVLYSHDGMSESNVVAEREEVDKPVNEIGQINSETNSYMPVAVQDTSVNQSPNELLVASASNDAFLIEQNKIEEPNKLKEIITNNLNFVVHFTPGSVTTESFYEEQFVTVLDLLQEMPEMELNLAGYSDRRGTEAENVQLASQRVASVRDYFIQHGIDEHRIKIHAYGEKKLLSTSGELDSYMFDRRVVLSFNLPTDTPQNNVAVAEPVTPTEHSDISPF